MNHKHRNGNGLKFTYCPHCGKKGFYKKEHIEHCRYCNYKRWLVPGQDFELKGAAMFLKKVTKQYKKPWVGAIKETLMLGLWWGVPLNFAMITGTFYYTTVRHIVSWVTPSLFFVVLGVGVTIILVVEYKLLMPSIWSWRENQMFDFQGKVMGEIEALKNLIIKGQKEKK